MARSSGAHGDKCEGGTVAASALPACSCSLFVHALVRARMCVRGYALWRCAVLTVCVCAPALRFGAERTDGIHMG